jgi:hypothetical protein
LSFHAVEEIALWKSRAWRRTVISSSRWTLVKKGCSRFADQRVGSFLLLKCVVRVAAKTVTLFLTVCNFFFFFFFFLKQIIGVEIKGVAACAGCSSGAPDVTVSLGKYVAVSDSKGAFEFGGVLPGTVGMAFSRGSWRQEAQVEVSWDVQLKGHEQLVLPGFTVSGKGTPEASLRLGELATVVDASGSWRFDAVPSGDYSLTALLTRGSRVFRPGENIKVRVGGGDAVVETPVSCVHFSVSGTTLPLAVVTVDGKKVTESDERGNFELLVVEGQKIVVGASKAGFVFSDVQFETSMAAVSPIVPRALLLCVQIDALPGAKELVVAVAGERKPVSHDGKVCFEVGRGEHSVSVTGAAFDKVDAIVVKDLLAALPTVHLRQTRGTLSGRVQSLPSLTTQLQVVMDGARVEEVSLRDGAFSFEHVLPGDHTLTLRGAPSWCWERDTLTVSTSSGSVVFVQKGFLLRHDCGSSLAPSSLFINDVEQKLECGRVHCVAGVPPESVVIRPNGCLRFEPSEVVLQVSPSSELSVKFEAAAWLIQGRLLGGKARLALDGAPLAVTADGAFSAEIALAAPGFRLVCEAAVPSQLCSPSVVESTSPVAKCLEPLLLSVGEGHFVQGRVQPAVAGVVVTVVCDGGVVSSAQSGPDGQWTVGPLAPTAVCGPPSGVLAMHSIVAATEDPLTLLLVPLSELLVQISDKKTGRPVSEVVLSLSGPGGYRKNELSGADGSFVFEQLVPGEYHLRPLLKEYSFEPGQVTVVLERGVRKELAVSGARVAFSAFGKVVGLNNEAEKLVSVVARQGGVVVAEGRSDEKGLFRVRGLLPGQRYVLSARDDRLERTAPAELEVVVPPDQDVVDLLFVAVRRLERAELAGAVGSEAPPETISVQLLKDGEVCSGVFFAVYNLTKHFV